MGPQMSPLPLPSGSTNQMSHKISKVQPVLSEQAVILIPFIGAAFDPGEWCHS